jgi:hypothetical protein
MNGSIAGAIDALFADPNIGKNAIWRAGGAGNGLSVRVVFRAPDATSNFGGGRFVAQTRFLDVRVSEIPGIEAGDSFEIGDEILIVQGEPIIDDDHLIWSVEVRAQ